MNRINLGAAFLAIGMTLFVIPVTAFAQPLVVTGERAPTAIVSYADLNLRSPHGVAKLNQRVRWTAMGLCGYGVIMPLQIKRQHDECRDFAIASAQPQIQTAIQSQRLGSYTMAALTLTRP